MTTSGGRRDRSFVDRGLVEWCQQHRPDIAEAGIEELDHVAAGMSNETIIIRCRPDPGGPDSDGSDSEGTGGQRLVVRLPPLVPTFPDLDFGLQARVQAAAAAGGVPTAVPVTVEEDPGWVGGPFITMAYVEGTIPGQASLFDPWLTSATPDERRDTQREMVGVLASIYAVDWRGVGLDELAAGGTGRLHEHLDRWEDYLAWASDGERLERIEEILRWCRAHAPDDVEPSLVWGDPRLENLVMDAQRRTRAVLDWELATIGPIEMDLGWYCGLERVLHELVGSEPLPGFAPASTVADDLAAAIGRPLQDPAWHEIFALTRSICINVRQAAISAQAGVEYPLAPGEANPMLPVVERWIAEHSQMSR